jgi:hypothetical protein
MPAIVRQDTVEGEARTPDNGRETSFDTGRPSPRNGASAPATETEELAVEGAHHEAAVSDGR